MTAVSIPQYQARVVRYEMIIWANLTRFRKVWASTTPHNHTYLSLEGNYCRQEDHTGAW